MTKITPQLPASYKIDFHRNTNFDKFILFKEHSNSWQELIKKLRAHAINWLKIIAELYDDPAQAAQFLQKYRDNPIFSRHRGNHWFQKIGRTASVIDIDKYIVSYLQQVPKVTLASVN